MSVEDSSSSPQAVERFSSNPNYPVVASLDAPLKIARWRVIGNSFLAIPHFIVLYVLAIVASLFTFIGWFAIVFTGQLPPGLGNFIAGVQRYQWRVVSYVLFLREDYPAFGIPSGYADPGGDAAVLNITPPTTYSRPAVIFRFIMIIPLAFVGFFLFIGMYIMMIGGFFGVLFTGKWPAGARKFVIDVEFFSIRVNAWYSLLADPYPPYAKG